MRRSIEALVVACIAVIAMVSAPLAANAAPADPIEFTTTPPESYHYWHFGSFDERLSVDSGVRTFVADPGLPIDETVRCWSSTSQQEYVEQTRTEAEWAASPTITLPDDFTVDPGDLVEVTCTTGQEEYYSGFYIRWSLTAVAGGSATKTLPNDPSTAWSRHSYDYVSPEQPTVVPARLGDAVRVTGPVGTFLPDQTLKGAFGLGDPRIGFDYLYFSEDAVVSADGSTLTFTLPTEVYPLFNDEILYARFATGPTTDEFPDGETSDRTVWWGGFDVSADAPVADSSTRIGLALSTALSVQRVRATAVVTVPDASSPAGPVTFLVDGVVVATAAVGTDTRSRASVLLPRLPRGRHLVTVEYGGSSSVSPSVSAPARLRILF